jgi:hypothetical protein
MFIMYDIVRARSEDDTSEILRFEKFADSTEARDLSRSSATANFRNGYFALLNPDNRPKLFFLLLFDVVYTIPTLEDLTHCLPMLRFIEQERDRIASNIR